MPPRPRRPERCVILEDGRQCRRNGTGKPALCARHAEVYRQMPASSPIAQIFDAVWNGRRPAKQTIAEAARQVAEKIIGRPLTDAEFQSYQGGGFHVFEAEVRSGPASSSSSRSSGSSGSRWGAPDPDARAKEQAELEKARRIGRARRTLGFTAKESITPEQLKERYRKLARKHHPDRGGSVERMQEINAAMEILSQPP